MYSILVFHQTFGRWNVFDFVLIVRRVRINSQIYNYIIMSLLKSSNNKRKITDEHRFFQQRWELLCFCCEMNNTIICLICNSRQHNITRVTSLTDNIL